MKNSITFDSTLAKFGVGIFETIKVLEKPIGLELHIDRMVNSIEELNINTKLNKKDLISISLDYIKDNNVKNKAFRITVFDQGYNISTRDITYNEEMYKNGVDLTISPIIRGDSILYRHKTTNYFENIYTKEYATNDGYFDGVFINANSEILETSMCNIFFIKDKKVLTPKSELPILNGIERSKIIRICEKLNIDCVESNIKLDEIKKYDFCFITNSLMSAMRVNKIKKVYYQKENQIFDQIQSELKIMEN